MVWFGLILLFIAVGVVIWRGRQVGELARKGVPVTGVVVDRFRTGKAGSGNSRGKRIAFTYTGPDGREYRRAASLTSSEWAKYEDGAAIDLICLPDNPGVSAPASIVEHAREALAKRK